MCYIFGHQADIWRKGKDSQLGKNIHQRNLL